MISGITQAITSGQALPILTINGARSLRLEKKTGSLSPDKWADFKVLEKSLTAMASEEIAWITPQETFWKGKSVYAER